MAAPLAQGISIYIDDRLSGSGAGSGNIPHDPETTPEQFVGDVPGAPGTLYDTYFGSDRRDIFHYALLGHDSPGTSSGYAPRPDAFWISDGTIPNSYLGHIFMHELGHNLNLNSDYLYADDTLHTFGCPWTEIDDDVYPSAMRYCGNPGVLGWPDERGFIDYSLRVGIETVFYAREISDGVFSTYWTTLNTDDWHRIVLPLGM